MNRAGLRMGLCFAIALALGSCAPSPAPLAKPLNQAASAIEPKIVVQLAHQQKVAGAAWINGTRNLATIDNSGYVVVWDTATRVIVDTVQLPIPETSNDSSDLTLENFAAEPGGKTIAVGFFVSFRENEPRKATDARFAAAYPKDARRADLWCTFALDTATRAVVPAVSGPSPARSNSVEEIEARLFPVSPGGKWSLVRNYDDGRLNMPNHFDEHQEFSDTTCVDFERCPYGITLVARTDPATKITLHGQPRNYMIDADISADGRRLVTLQESDNHSRATAQVLDLVNGNRLPAYKPQRTYQAVSWLGGERFAMFSRGYSPSNDLPDAQLEFPPVRIVDQQCARSDSCARVASFGNMVPLGDTGAFAGVGSLAGCYRMDPNVNCGFQHADGAADGWSILPVASGISVHAATAGPGAKAWKLAQQPDWGKQQVTSIKLSPDGSQLAVATSEAGNNRDPNAVFTLRLTLLDVDGDTLRPGGRVIFRKDIPFRSFPGLSVPSEESAKLVSDPDVAIRQGLFMMNDGTSIFEMSFTPDGSQIAFTQGFPETDYGFTTYVVDTAGGTKPREFPQHSQSQVVAGSDRLVGLDKRELLDLADGHTVAALGTGLAFQRAGYIAASRLIWTMSDDKILEFWDQATGAKQLTLYLLPDNRFFAVAPGGRYDTSLAPDNPTIRWMVPDAPWQSLGPQTFMRDFYEPELYRKLLDCRAADNCGDVFKQLPSIASLNRVLPRVAITAVRPGKDAAEAVVTMTVQDGVDPSAANGKAHSGVFNTRLFRGGRVVAMNPDEPDKITDTLERWRALNDVAKEHRGAAKTYEFTVPLPTAAGTETQEFTAYAFNEDRIKSDTASFTYTRPAAAPRKPRAYVVAIGINDYDTERFRLNYAVSDARLIADRLHDIPGYEMRRVTLAGEKLSDGTRVRVDNATIRQVLSLIMTDSGRDQTLGDLARQHIDAAPLEQATPDDIVIVSFSGHGWADKQGNFYLVPTNGYMIADDKPELRSLLATADLTMYFRAIDAAEITLIIDACHSSASVANAGFKPGPMGDSGLGQLAYDKGIRILAATQSDDVAFEDASLKQGLLTYALADEGLTAKGDLNGDHKVGLDEWLAYAVQRLPSLSQDARLGQLSLAAGSREIEFHDLPAGAIKRRVQQPTLFDFNRAPSAVYLRKTAG